MSQAKLFAFSHASVQNHSYIKALGFVGFILKKTSDKRIASTAKGDRVREALLSFRRVVTSVKRHLAVKDGDTESALSGAQMWALWHIQGEPGLTVQGLADKLSVHQSTTSNLVEKLKSAGCLRAVRNAPDKRVVRLFVTRAGAKVLKQAPDPASGTLPEAFNRLSGQELAALELALQSLTRELSVTPKSSRRVPST